jgi:transcriptional regulator with XRE-family HTH domain
MTITGEQVKAARALLKWPQHRLAAEIGVSQSEINSFESGRTRLSVLQASVLKRILETVGVEFADGAPGARLKVASPEAEHPAISDEAALPDIPDVAEPYDGAPV